MPFLKERCILRLLTEELQNSCEPFKCGNDDLDDFFREDAALYAKHLLGKTYCYVLKEQPQKIVCAFTISNDSVKVDDLPNNRRKKVNARIPRAKQMRRYPAVLIGRLGVNKEFAHEGIGTEVIEMLKWWFVEPNNKTGCRYIAVDAYNDKTILNFYCKRNGFKPLFFSDEQEAVSSNKSLPLNTRYLYFDLIDIASLSSRIANQTQ